MNHNILNCEALWPRINQAYKWNEEQRRTLPADDQADRAAHYDINILLTEDQLKEMLAAMRAEWEKGVAEKRITASIKDPKTIAKIEKQEDGRYKVECKQKNYDKKSKPMQFGPDTKRLPDDFELTTGSKIHISLRFYFYKGGEGLHIQPKKVRVVELAERVEVDDFEAPPAEISDSEDPFGLPPAESKASDQFDDEIPF